MRREECKRPWGGAELTVPAGSGDLGAENHPAGLRDRGGAGGQAGGGWRTPGSAQTACCFLSPFCPPG